MAKTEQLTLPSPPCLKVILPTLPISLSPICAWYTPSQICLLLVLVPAVSISPEGPSASLLFPSLSLPYSNNKSTLLKILMRSCYSCTQISPVVSPDTWYKTQTLSWEPPVFNSTRGLPTSLISFPTSLHHIHGVHMPSVPGTCHVLLLLDFGICSSLLPTRHLPGLLGDSVLSFWA